MSNGRNGKKGRKGRGIALSAAALVMTAAAVAATAYVVMEPDYFARIRAVPASTSGASSSSAQPSSSASSSSAVSASTPSSSSVPASSAPPPSSSSGSAPVYTDFKNAVFIGDSLTLGMDEYSVTQTAGIFADNGMSTSAALTKKITVAGKSVSVPDAVKAASPKRIYIMLGANDISWMKASTFITNYGKLIDTLKAGSPNAVIYIQAIFPVTAAYEKSSGVTNALINDFNTRLSQLCAQKGVKYVDPGTVLRGSDGKMVSEAAADGYNIKRDYYKPWFNYLTAHQ